MKKVFKKVSRHTFPGQKPIKTVFLTQRRHVLYLITIFFEEYFLMSGY